MSTNFLTSINQLSFLDELLPAVQRGEKTITIRSQAGLKFQPGKRVQVVSHTTGQAVCEIEITAVEAIRFQDISESHARSEQMSLAALKELIAKIYPNTKQLSVISFTLIQAELESTHFDLG